MAEGMPDVVVLFALDRACAMGHQVELDNWRVRILPGSRALIVEATKPFTGDDPSEEALRVAQVALDVLSVGAGAYAIVNPRSGRLLIRPGKSGRHLHISQMVPLTLPFGVITAKAGNPITNDRKGGKPHEALRYFRMAQLATDAFSAFHLMYLCFERLLSERVAFRPAEPEHAKESESAWIERALNVVVPDYADLPKPNERPEFWKEFPTRVYQDVRCNLFHAKKGRPVLLPSRAADVAKVQWALQLVTEHVLELARPFLGYPPTARPLMDHELASRGGYVGAPPKVGLLCMDASRKQKEFSMLETQRLPDGAHLGLAVFAASIEILEELPKGLSASGLRIEGPLFPTEVTFDARLPLDGVRHLEIELAQSLRMDQNIRTIYAHRA